MYAKRSPWTRLASGVEWTFSEIVHRVARVADPVTITVALIEVVHVRAVVAEIAPPAIAVEIVPIATPHVERQDTHVACAGPGLAARDGAFAVPRPCLAVRARTHLRCSALRIRGAGSRVRNAHRRALVVHVLHALRAGRIAVTLRNPSPRAVIRNLRTCEHDIVITALRTDIVRESKKTASAVRTGFRTHGQIRGPRFADAARILRTARERARHARGERSLSSVRKREHATLARWHAAQCARLREARPIDTMPDGHDMLLRLRVPTPVRVHPSEAIRIARAYARVADAVPVRILLFGIRNVRAVIRNVRDAVTITIRNALPIRETVRLRRIARRMVADVPRRTRTVIHRTILVIIDAVAHLIKRTVTIPIDEALAVTTWAEGVLNVPITDVVARSAFLAASFRPNVQPLDVRRFTVRMERARRAIVVRSARIARHARSGDRVATLT